MYVRQITRVAKDGRKVRYLQLAEKVRDPETGIPRDKILLHLGPEDRLDKDQLKRLVLSLSRFLDEADQTAIRAGLEGAESTLPRVGSPLPYGASYVLDALWRRLGLDFALRSLLAERAYQLDIERLIFAMVANRALDPRSKLAIEQWVGKKVAIDGLEEVSAQSLYRAMDFLVEHDETIQRAVFEASTAALNLEVDLVFFDTTSTYFELDQADPEGEDGAAGLRRYGHSKDHRPDLPQIVIGLAVTREGIPIRCWTLPGNTADASVVEQVQKELAGWKLSRVVWVMDRGFNGEDQRRMLQRGGGQFIIGEKLRAVGTHNEEALKRPGRFQKVRDNLEVKEVVVEEDSLKRRFVVVRNAAQANKDKTLRDAAIERLSKELTELQVSRKGRKQGHSKAVAALLTHPTYARYLKELPGGKLAIDRTKVRSEEKLDGKYLLSTSDFSLTAEEVALGYKQLLEVERAFRTLKSTLDLRPIYHRLPERIRAHVLLCFLALLLVRVAEHISDKSWAPMRDELERLAWVPILGKDRDVQLLTELTPEQRNLLKILQISAPGRTRQQVAKPDPS